MGAHGASDSDRIAGMDIAVAIPAVSVEMPVSGLEEVSGPGPTVWFGVGRCPGCGHGPTRAEVGAVGYCPACGTEVVAVVPDPTPVVQVHVGRPDGNTGHLNVGSHGRRSRRAADRYAALDWGQCVWVDRRRDELTDAGDDLLTAWESALDACPPSRLTATGREVYDRLRGAGVRWSEAYERALEAA